MDDEIIYEVLNDIFYFFGMLIRFALFAIILTVVWKMLT